jgi:ubiquinone/menaquinone biosynthesis C-methylase UbiE
MDRQQVLDEYLRIIKPKGILILIENLPHNPFINLYRRYRRKTSNTPEEVKYVNSIRGYITLGEIDIFAENFLHSEHREFHFSRMVTIYLRAAFQANSISMKLDTLLSNLDKKLFSVFPFLKRFAWFTALYCEQKKNV